MISKTESLLGAEVKIPHFTSYLSTFRNFTETTISDYRRYVTEFVNYFFNRRIDSINKVDIQSYINNVITTRSEIVASASLYSIRCFFEYLISEGLVSINPTSLISVSTPRIRKAISLIESRRIYDCLVKDNSGSERFLYVKVIYWTGISVSEFCDLRVNNFTWADDSPTLLVKNRSSQRTIPIPVEIAKEVKDLIQRRSDSASNSKYLFPTTRGKRYLRGNIYKIVREVLISICTTEMGPRKLKQAFVTNILSGYPQNMSAVRSMIGVRDLNSLTIYISAHFGRLAQVHRQFHPRA